MSGPRRPSAKAQRAAADTRRWGIFTLLFLGLAFAMVVVSSTAGHYTILTLAGLVVGLVGAGWCTVKGWRKAKNFRL
jgi:hypothetical protein